MIFHGNRLLADDSHVISYLIIFRKLEKMSQNLSSVAVVIGTLRVILLSLCRLGNFFNDFLLSADFFYLKLTFSKNYFRNTIRVSNSLNPDQARHFVGPDLGPNSLQRLSANDTSMQKN